MGGNTLFDHIDPEGMEALNQVVEALLPVTDVRLWYFSSMKFTVSCNTEENSILFAVHDVNGSRVNKAVNTDAASAFAHLMSIVTGAVMTAVAEAKQTTSGASYADAMPAIKWEVEEVEAA